MTVTVSGPIALVVHQVLGEGAAAHVRNQGYPLPAEQLTAVGHGNGFVAQTGGDEFLVADAGDWRSPGSPPPWSFRRCDHIVELMGADWADVLADLCPHDLRGLAPGTWLLVTIAGVDSWLFGPSQSSGGVLLGCDPSYGHYLQTTLEQVAAETAALSSNSV